MSPMASEAKTASPSPGSGKARGRPYQALADRGYTLGDLLGKGAFGQVNRIVRDSTGEVYVGGQGARVTSGVTT